MSHWQMPYFPGWAGTYYDERENRRKPIPSCADAGLVWNSQTQRCERAQPSTALAPSLATFAPAPAAPRKRRWGKLGFLDDPYFPDPGSVDLEPGWEWGTAFDPGWSNEPVSDYPIYDPVAESGGEWSGPDGEYYYEDTSGNWYYLDSSGNWSGGDYTGYQWGGDSSGEYWESDTGGNFYYESGSGDWYLAQANGDWSSGDVSGYGCWGDGAGNWGCSDGSSSEGDFMPSAPASTKYTQIVRAAQTVQQTIGTIAGRRQVASTQPRTQAIAPPTSVALPNRRMIASGRVGVSESGFSAAGISGWMWIVIAGIAILVLRK